MELMIGENFINTENSIPIVPTMSYVQGPMETAYKKQLTTAMEPDNFVDKYATECKCLVC